MSTRRVTVAPGVTAPARITASEPQIVSLAEKAAYRVDAVLVWDDEQRRFLCETVNVTRRGRTPVTGEWLRRLRIEAMTAEAVQDRLRGLKRPAGMVGPWGMEDPPADVREQGLDAARAWAAHLNRIGHAINGEGVRYAADRLGISRQTAWRWIQEAEK